MDRNAGSPYLRAAPELAQKQWQMEQPRRPSSPPNMQQYAYSAKTGPSQMSSQGYLYHVDPPPRTDSRPRVASQGSKTPVSYNQDQHRPVYARQQSRSVDFGKGYQPHRVVAADRQQWDLLRQQGYVLTGSVGPSRAPSVGAAVSSAYRITLSNCHD